jgi:hypothetical protein
MTIYITFTDPDTKEATAPSHESGFETLEDVEVVMGEPLHKAKRTRTYSDMFFSDYKVA